MNNIGPLAMLRPLSSRETANVYGNSEPQLAPDLDESRRTPRARERTQQGGWRPDRRDAVPELRVRDVIDGQVEIWIVEDIKCVRSEGERQTFAGRNIFITPRSTSKKCGPRRLFRPPFPNPVSAPRGGNCSGVRQGTSTARVQSGDSY
jgi:hypothetical protein